MDDFIYDRDHDLDLTAAQAHRLYRMADLPDALLDDDATTRALARIGLTDTEPTTSTTVTTSVTACPCPAVKARHHVDGLSRL